MYLKVGVYQSGIKKGKTHDHGATFEIFDTKYMDLFNETIIKRKEE